MQHDFALVIDQQHGYVVIALDDAEQEVDIGLHGRASRVVVAHGGQFLGGIGPNLHAVALLLGQVTHDAA